MSEVTLLLQAVSQGDRHASEELLPLVYDELRHLASARMAREPVGQTLQPTALVHEAWIRLSGPRERHWNNREHFFRAAAQAMRRILVDRSRQKSSLKRGRGQERLNIDDLDLAAATPDERVLMIDEALGRLEHEDADSARIVSLKFFGGFTNKEIAAMDGVTERTIERQWAYARACIFELIRRGM